MEQRLITSQIISIATSNLRTNIKKFGKNLTAIQIQAISPISSNITLPPFGFYNILDMSLHFLEQ